MYIVYINIVIIIFGFWFLVALREIFAASGGLKSRPVCVCLPPHHRHHHRHLDHHCVWYTLVQLAEDIFTLFWIFSVLCHNQHQHFHYHHHHHHQHTGWFLLPWQLHTYPWSVSD